MDDVFLVEHHVSWAPAARAIDGARWDPIRRTWRIPVARVADIEHLAAMHGLTIDGLTVRAPIVEPAITIPQSRIENREIAIPNFADGRSLYAYQEENVRYAAARGWRALIADEPGLGKGHPIETPILTPTGWRPIGDLVVGDQVIGSDGKPITVTAVHPRGKLRVYDVRFTDGATVRCDGDHLWAIQDRNRRNRDGGHLVISTREIMAGVTVRRKHRNGRVYECMVDLQSDGRWSIPLVAPVEYAPVDLPLDPYLLGVLLGDGCLRRRHGLTFTTADAETVTAVAERLPPGVSVRACPGSGYDYAITQGQVGGRPHPVRTALRSLGLDGTGSHDKFIPEPYLRASPEDRLEVLRGLLDTDGHVRPADNNIEYATASPHLADDVAEIVRSLGGLARITRRGAGAAEGQFRVTVQMPGTLNPFRLTRKANAYKPRAQYQPLRIMESVNAAGMADVVCIAVDAPDRLYVTQNYIVTHNTASALTICELAGRWPVVLVVPSVVETHWAREVVAWFPHRTVRVLRGRTPFPLQGRAHYYVIGYSVIAWWLRAIAGMRPGGLVVDEAHRIKDGGAQQSRAVRAIAAPGTDVGIPEGGPILPLTGTPVLNRTDELFEAITLLGAWQAMGGSRQVRRRYVRMDDIDPDDTGAIRVRRAELSTLLRSVCMIRHRKIEVLTDLPPKRRIPVWVDGDPVTMDEYQRADRKLMEYLAERARAYAIANGLDPDGEVSRKLSKAEKAEALVRINTLREIAARAKVPSALEWARDYMTSGNSLAVYAHHHPIIDMLAPPLGAARITGKQSKAQRDRAIDGFQDGSVRVLVVGIAAAGVGITLTAGSDPLLIELAWNPGALTQAEDRHHRIGQHDNVTATYILARETIDETMWRILVRKAEEIDHVVDGSDQSAIDGGWADPDDAVSSGSVFREVLDELTRKALDAIPAGDAQP